MVFIACGGVFGVLAGLRLVFNDMTDIGFVFLGLLMTALCGVFGCGGGLVLAIAAGGAFGTDLMDQQPSERAVLASLRTADGVSGSVGGGLFLISGVIGTDQFYFYYKQDGDALVQGKVMAGPGAYIYEEERAGGELDVYQWHTVMPHAWMKWLTVELGPPSHTYYFHVPKGSVRRQFNVQ